MIPIRDAQRNRRAPLATWALLAANAAVFAWELSLGERADAVLARVAVSPAETVALADPLLLPLRLLASLFLHGSWLHLLGNLAFLAVFGDDVEGRLRRARFLLLYLLSGLAASLAQIAATPRSTLPLVGASGAIAGVLGAFLVLFPRARLTGVLPVGCLVLPLRSRAFLFIPGWFALQLAGALLAPPGAAAGGVAWYAHLAGFVAGPLLLLLLRRR
ncbi:MAG: rhomboid family intramembrane serine protease [Thermoanaerobaculia bacterium]|nr:MAG: rhomboid family intramembrane serine protease [Thermoanaerobaculia bacterium]